MLTPTDNSPATCVNTRKRNRLGNSIRTVVVIGSSLFALLYIIAAISYPGGSNADATAHGFSILTNYWCDLLGSHAKNGQPNAAQPIAVTAMVLLCLTLGYFWLVTPRLFWFSTVQERGLQTAGVLSMVVAPFIMTPYHDTVINIAGLLGVVALLGTLTGLYRRQWFGLLGFGALCLALCGLNNYIYQTRHLIHYLPVIQKITFLFFLIWFLLIGLNLRRNTTNL